MHRSGLSWWLAAWTLTAAGAASAWDHLWATIALPLLILTLLPLLFLGFFLSGAVAGSWVPPWSLAARIPAAALGAAALHFAVLYILGAAAFWPVRTLADPLRFAHPGQWVVMCTLAAAAGVVVSLRARPSNARPAWAAS